MRLGLRILIVVQILAIIYASADAAAEPASSGTVLIEDLPPFVSPLRLHEGSLPEGGEVKEVDGLVCYDEPAHSRLLIFMHNTQPASDLRAMAAWNDAYALGYEEGATRAIDMVETKRPSMFSVIVNSKLFWLSVGAVSAYSLMEIIK